MELERAIEQLNQVVFDLIIELYRKFSDQGADIDLKIKEHLVIELLGRKGAIKMSDLAAYFALPPTTVTSIVDRLVDKNYIERKRSKQDRRVVLVTLSDKGQEFFTQHEKEQNQQLGDILSVLSAEELQQLVKTFSKVSEQL